MSKKTINALTGTFEKIARAISGRHDIKVVVSSQCATDGRTIFIPSNADKVSEGSREVMAGWLDHENGHIQEEDEHRKVGKITPLEYMNKHAKTRKERSIMNVYEDIRSETKKARELIGVAHNLKAAQIHSTRHVTDRISEDGFNDFWYAIGCAIIHEAHGMDTSYLPAAYRPYIDALQEEIAESTDLTKTRWADDTWALTQRTLAKINDAAEEMRDELNKRTEPQTEDTEEGEDTSEGEEGEDTGEGGAEGDSEDDTEEGTEIDTTIEDTEKSTEDADSEPGQGSDSTDDDGTENDSESGEGDNGDEDTDAGEGTDDPTGGGKSGDHDDMSDDDVAAAADLADQADQDAKANDLMDEVVDELNKEAEHARQVSGDYSVHPRTRLQDRWSTPKANEDSYQHARQLVAKQIRGMKGKLLNLIRAQAEDTIISDQDEGDLDVDALHSVKTGNRRVFTKTVAGQTLDTVVSILIDQSGSMGHGYQIPGTRKDGSIRRGSKAFYAKAMAIALAETFNALNIPCEVIGFHNHFSFTSGTRCTPAFVEGCRGTDRCQPYEFHVYKSFDEKYRKAAPRLGSITGYEDNADGEAVLETAKRLAVRREMRKIMFVLSDGLPLAQSVEIEILKKNLKDTVKLITDAGIEVIGIGAMTDSVVQFYNEKTGASNMVVSNIDKLATQVYKVMKERLLGRKGKKGRAA